MPENGLGRKNAISNPSNASADNLQEDMLRLKIQGRDDRGEQDSHCNPYPDRPGEPDCIYYLKRGMCGYGNNCLFNHPTNAGQGSEFRDELPERVGEPDCQYFLKTGTCKFGASCKYHHPRDRLNAGLVPLNILGLPMRQEEKSCSYYMRTGACKFGIACKFHHPPPAQLGAVLSIAHPAYDSKGSSASASSGLPYAGGIPAWSLPSAPYMSNPHMEGHAAYMPVVLSPQVIPTQRDWSFYTNSISPVLTTEALGSNQLPQRPDQPDCQFYLKTQRCKFGQSCKYHHPKQMNASEVNGTLGPLGLPLRPVQAICTSYCMYGICKYGSACKYDHPVSGYYSYSLPSLSIPDQTLIPYYSNSPVTCSPSETSPSKSLNLQSHPSKPESTSFKQNPDMEAPEYTQQQTVSPNTVPASS